MLSPSNYDAFISKNKVPIKQKVKKSESSKRVNYRSQKNQKISSNKIEDSFILNHAKLNQGYLPFAKSVINSKGVHKRSNSKKNKDKGTSKYATFL